MLSENTGPVAVTEIQQVVADLNALLARAVEHHQHPYGMVLHLAAESLADNLEQVGEWVGDDA